MRFLLFFISTAFIYGQADALSCSDVRLLEAQYRNMHFSFKNFDDTLSSRVFDNFLKAWDSQKLYFFAADVAELEKKYKTKIDDMIPSENCEFVSSFMDLYYKRFAERQKHIYKLVDQKFDFAKDEYLDADFEKMPYASTTEELDERWRKRIKYQLKILDEGIHDLAKSSKKLRKRYERLLKRHNEQTDSKILSVFMNAYSQALDPHSSYMPAEQLEDFRIRTRLSLEGIGASLRSEDGYTIVVSLIKGGAAEKGGLLEEGDKIIAVAQGKGKPVDVVEMDLQEVVQLIRGARGTEVRLTVLRGDLGEQEKLVVPIIREKIQLTDQAAKSHVFQVKVEEGKEKADYKVGVINLPSFYIDFEGRHKRLKNYRSSSRDVEKLLNQAKKQGLDALVVDLRSNGGGSLEESVKLAGLFFDQGPVVQTKPQEGKSQALYDTDPGSLYDGPLVVLVNRHSASASEIFAGAIQDYERGLIIGDEHTFGKGTVQHLHNLTEKLGAIKVTVNKFYRPSGKSTQNKGVESDIALPSLMDELEVGEKFYDYVLPYEVIEGVPFKKFNMVSPYRDQLAKLSESRVKLDKDFKEVFADIEKYKKEKDDRNKISLKIEANDEKKSGKDPDKQAKKEAKEAKKLAKKEKKKDKKALAEEFDIEDDFYLRETLNITVDYVRLLGGKKTGAITIQELAVK